MELSGQVSSLIKKSAASRYFKINRQAPQLILESWWRRGQAGPAVAGSATFCFELLKPQKCWKEAGRGGVEEEEKEEAELQPYRFFFSYRFLSLRLAIWSFSIICFAVHQPFALLFCLQRISGTFSKGVMTKKEILCVKSSFQKNDLCC